MMLSYLKSQHPAILLKTLLGCFPIIILGLPIFCISSPNIYTSANLHKHDHQHNQFLYVLAGQEILAYRISRDGVLKQIPFASPYLGRLPGFLAVPPCGGLLYAGGIEDEYQTPSGYVSGFSVSRNGVLSQQKSVPAGKEPLTIAFGNFGRSIYIVSDGLLYSFKVSSTGSFAPAAAPIRVGPSAFVAASPNGRFLWIAQGRAVTLYRIAATGGLKQAGGFRLPKQPSQIVWDPKGKFVFVSYSGTGTVTEFALKEQPHMLGSTQVTAGSAQVRLAILPGGRSLLIGDMVKSRVGTISLMPNGKPVGRVKWCRCPYPFAITLSEDGQFVYALDPKDNLIAQFAIKNGNILLPLKPASVQAANHPLSFVIASS